jgi:hypothetical protein
LCGPAVRLFNIITLMTDSFGSVVAWCGCFIRIIMFK